MGTDLVLNPPPPPPIHEQVKALVDRNAEMGETIRRQGAERKELVQERNTLRDILVDQETALRTNKANALAALATLRMEMGQLPEDGIQQHNLRHVESMLVEIAGEAQ